MGMWMPGESFDYFSQQYQCIHEGHERHVRLLWTFFFFWFVFCLFFNTNFIGPYV
jgi:hypothetical protein